MKQFRAILICLLAAVLLLPGCSASTETFEEKEYTAKGTEINAVRIDVRDRNIQVQSSQEGVVSIRYRESEKEAYDFSVSDEGVLTMTYEPHKDWQDHIGGKASLENRTIVLTVPEDTLCSLEISTTNEDISIGPLKAEAVSADANNGNIRIEKLDVGSSAAFSTKNGDIKGTLAGSYDDFTISSQVKKGESNLPERLGSGEKTLTASANNGDIDIEITG